MTGREFFLKIMDRVLRPAGHWPVPYSFLRNGERAHGSGEVIYSNWKIRNATNYATGRASLVGMRTPTIIALFEKDRESAEKDNRNSRYNYRETRIN
jgi:hypothetical protein